MFLSTLRLSLDSRSFGVEIMARQRYLVGYDICESKRLRNVHKVMCGYGDPLQYSVFVCDLDGVELLGMRQDLAAIIHHNEDSILIVDLGPARTRGEECFTFMGVQPLLPTGEAEIV